MGAVRKLEEDTVVYIPASNKKAQTTVYQTPRGEDIRLPPQRLPKTRGWEEGETLDW